MIRDELRALYDQMSDEEKNENSVLKGRFTKYITRRLEWHAIRYAAHKGKSIVTISLDNILDEPQDERAAEMLHKSARLCHLHGENLPQYRRLSATSSAPLPPKSSAGNPTDRARRY